MSVSLPIPPVLDAAGKAIVDSALKVHTALGPGLIESVYELCLAHELNTRGFDVARQVPLPVVYEGLRLDGGFRLDLLVANGVIVEIKAAEQHNRLFEAQLLTYLRLSGLRLGFLINFNVTQLRQGIKRMVY